MAALDTALRRLRAEALRVERASQRAILVAWAQTMARLAPYITAAIAQAAATQASLPPGATFAVAALPTVRALMAAMQAETRTFALVASTAVAAGQGAAVASAPALAADAVLAALGTPPAGAAIPTLARSALFVPNEGAAQLAATIARLAPGMGDAGAKAIADGVRAGKSPRAIARDVRATTNMAPTRALLVSRESVNRGFRESALANYRANRAYVSGWRWLCARGPRTCGLCFAMDGKVFDVDEPFASHPACRCVPVPISRPLPGWDTPEQPESGREAFARLSAAEQRQILGPGKMALFLSGDLDWDALTQDTFSPVYGAGRRETPLRELRRAG